MIATRTLSARWRALPLLAAVPLVMCAFAGARAAPLSLLEVINGDYSAGLFGSHRAGEFAANVPDALPDGDHAEPREHVHGGLQQLHAADVREQEPDREDHDADGARGDPDLALDAERLGAGAGVGDHQRGEHGDDDGGGGDALAVQREIAGYGGEHDPLLDAVERGVEEGAERGALAGHPRVAPIEGVHDGADDERDAAEHEQLPPDEDRGEDVQREPGERDRVGREARLDEPVAHELAALGGAERDAP